MRYYKAYNRSFKWKYEAENFARKVKAGAKKLHRKVGVRILPVTSFSSSTAQRWSVLDKIRGSKEAETRTVGYVVRWHYKPPRGSA